MTAGFDPYYEWLGIPAKDQPPHHYRLLSIELFEASPKVVELAADRQMGHIRSFQIGPQADASQKLLSELSAARLCLLNPQAKATYDVQLRARLTQAEKSSAPTASNTAMSSPVSRPAGSAPPKELRTRVEPAALPKAQPLAPKPAVAEVKPPTKMPKPVWQNPLVISGGAGAVLVVLLAVVLLMRGGDQTPPRQQVADNSTSSSTDQVAPTAANATDPSGGSKKKTIATKQVAKPPVDKPAPTVAAPRDVPASQPDPASAPTTVAAPAVPDKDPVESHASESEQPAPADPREEPRPVATKPPIPDETEQKAALAALHEVAKDEYAKAKKPEDKAALAGRLLNMANDATGNVAEQYVMLNEAGDFAAAGGDLQLALTAATTLSEKFDVDAWKLKLAWTKQALTSARAKVDRKTQVAVLLTMADQAAREDRYDEAGKIVDLAAGMRQLEPETRKNVLERKKHLKQLADEWEAVRTAQETLASTPEEPAANLTVGKFFCIVKRDWQRGLPYLAQGSDAALQAVAQADLAGPTDTELQVKLGDQWWTVAEQLKPAGEKTAARQRAGDWYLRAVPELKGIAKAQVDKRLKQTARVFDLLEGLQLGRAFKSGNWQFDSRNHTLVSPTEHWARLQFDFVPPPQYEVLVEIELLETVRGDDHPGDFAWVVGLSHDPAQFLAVMDWKYSGYRTHTGVGFQNGKEIHEPGDTVTADFLNTKGQRHLVVYSVRDEGVEINLDGKSLYTWRKDFGTLSIPTYLAVPDKRRLFIATKFASYRVSRLEVRPL